MLYKLLEESFSTFVDFSNVIQKYKTSNSVSFSSQPLAHLLCFLTTINTFPVGQEKKKKSFMKLVDFILCSLCTVLSFPTQLQKYCVFKGITRNPVIQFLLLKNYIQRLHILKWNYFQLTSSYVLDAKFVTHLITEYHISEKGRWLFKKLLFYCLFREYCQRKDYLVPVFCILTPVSTILKDLLIHHAIKIR